MYKYFPKYILSKIDVELSNYTEKNIPWFYTFTCLTTLSFLHSCMYTQLHRFANR